MNVTESLNSFLIPEVYMPVIIILISILLIRIANKVIRRLLGIKIGKINIKDKREKTLSSLINSVVKAFVWLTAIIMILNLYGVNTTSIIASLGVLGIAVGLGAQDVIKDFMSGFFIIVDKKYNVGDIVEINNFKGEVIQLGLQTTRIQSWTGEIKIIFNRNVDEVTNFSITNSMAIVDVSVSYDADVKKVEKVLTELTKKLTKELENLYGDVELLGVQELADSSVNFRIIAPTKPMEHYVVQRQILKEVKLILDKEKIEIPYPQLDVHGK